MFKLTDEMIEKIEETVNKGLEDVHSGMKERLIKANCYNEYSFFPVCWVTMDIEDGKVKIIDPIKSCSEIDENLIQWLANGERGLSSETIATKLSGINCMGPFDSKKFGWSPSDPDDFRRCLLLLEQVPEFKERLHEMKEVSELWGKLVDNWDEFDKLYYEEWDTGKCPKLFDRMKEIVC